MNGDKTDEPGAPEGQAPQVDSGLACLAMMAQFLEVPCDPGQLRHERGKPGEAFSVTDILVSAKSLNIKARTIETTGRRLEKTPLPAIAGRADGSFFILAKVAHDEDKVLIQDPATGKPETVSRETFEQMWDGTLILLTTRKMLTGDQRRFDVSWFIPAVVKYRKILGEVLLSSLFIQVFALISPLFFMVIIDKVLVHRGLSSLDVLIFALVVVSAFEVLLGGLRTYIFSHTTNRIDVELGAQLFKHLMHLPIAYFGARRVGDTVARVRELETIRNFLTGSGLTLVVDLGFTFVFFAVMFGNN
jgi:subfamily B ATP-binding cassette protein HlyB/CyaB